MTINANLPAARDKVADKEGIIGRAWFTFLQRLALTAEQWKGVPAILKSTDYTFAYADRGKSFIHPASDANSRTFTIPANSVCGFEIGDVITVANRSANALSIAITTDTLYIAGSTTSGTRTIATNGLVTLYKAEATVWLISGSGIS